MKTETKKSKGIILVCFFQIEKLLKFLEKVIHAGSRPIAFEFDWN